MQAGVFEQKVGGLDAYHQTKGVADVTEAREDFIKEDVGAREQTKILTDQYFTPFWASDSAVELTHVDGGVSTVSFAVVDGDPERRTPAEFQTINLLAKVEADPVG